MVVKLLLEYVGENDFSSPIFKDLNSGYYFGSLDILVPDEEKGLIDEKSITEYFKNNPTELVYFGRDFDDDPNGGRLINVNIEFV